jgi:hypothetical protein
MTADEITDGHGNWWTKCHIDDCDLHVTRPGSTDCHREFCYRTLRSSETGEMKYPTTLPNKEQHQ